MRELLKNAWFGWERYAQNGKFVAFLLVVLLIFWISWLSEAEGRKASGASAGLRSVRKRGPQTILGLLVYTSLMTAACICPVTAVCLMLYQTRFYNYEWIWSLVPVTAVIAAGGSVLLDKMWEDYTYPKKNRYLRAAAFTAAVVALFFFGGSMGQWSWYDDVTGDGRAQVEVVLEQMVAEQAGEEIFLWAPKEVMACARAYSGEIRLLYGRDMWDAALGAYTYEVYDETRQELYQWMSQAEVFGTLVGTVDVLFENEAGEVRSVKKPVNGTVCIQNALDMGANYILLPGNMQEEDLEQIERTFAVEAEELGGYIWLRSAE